MSLRYRAVCHVCRRPQATCYCSLVKPFESRPRFVILCHPREAKHRLGTARMAHLAMTNSLLLEGVDFSRHCRVNEILSDNRSFCTVLYPATKAINLSALPREQRTSWVPHGKEWVVFVLDGTWKSVRTMIRSSENLQRLPFVCFDPSQPSTYRIRKQPQPNFYSTIEAIHHVIDLAGSHGDERVLRFRSHDNLRAIFHRAIDRQLTYAP